MAHSFRFIYWKICCYLCIRPKKRKKKHRSLITYRAPTIRPKTTTNQIHSPPPPPALAKDSPKNPSLKRMASSNSSYHTAPNSVINDTASTPSTTSPTASPIASQHSTTPPSSPCISLQQKTRHQLLPAGTSCTERQTNLPLQKNQTDLPLQKNEKDLPLLKLDPHVDITFVPIISNKYALQGTVDLPIEITSCAKDSPLQSPPIYSIVANRNITEYQYGISSPPLKSNNCSLTWKHHRFQAEADIDLMDSHDSLNSEDADSNNNKEVDVPMWLCLTLVVSYICGGAVLFTFWEKWNFLDSSYFCFVTLTTIGFGDLVPGTAVISDDNQMTLGLCSLYLLFGMALLAMSFNLVQEEVTRSVRCIGQRMGIVSDDEDD